MELAGLGFTAIFVFEAVVKIIGLGCRRNLSLTVTLALALTLSLTFALALDLTPHSHPHPVQWMAASRSGREVVYFPFGDPRAAGIGEAAEQILKAKVTVGQLAKAIFGKGAALAKGKALDVAVAALCG